MKTIAIILPAYNEGLTISKVIEEFHAAIPDAAVVVIDNNSSDDTSNIAGGTIKRLGVQGRVISEPRIGKGNAVRRAFKDVDADVYVLCDADCTYPADECEKLVQPVLDDVADMVVGDRHTSGQYLKENKRRLHNAGNALVKSLVNRLFNARLHDIMSGYRAFSRQFVKNYPILVGGFQLETDMTLHALDKRFRIAEIPISYRDRPEGSFSKLSTINDGILVIFTIIKILRYYRPLLFFGSLALVFGALGLFTSIPVFQDWFEFRYIYHVPLAILSASLEIVAVLALSLGLVLDSINHQHRMNYEREQLQGRHNG